ncbi:MAG: ribosomal protein S18-alanine N-acetyltransferase [Anaerolineae bacterium]|nr:ribosomal protein S18-alanine N-acetyltransferase [Anaerolineae bacterium]
MLPQDFPFDDPSLPYCVNLMEVDDLEQVIKIEQVAFSAPWPASAYRYELTKNDLSTYLVLRQRHPPPMPPKQHFFRRKPQPSILAYGGFWVMVDEAHISTIATLPEWRGHGLGEMILVAMIDAAILRKAILVTLEVRVSNEVAQNLYHKYHFAVVGRRKGYYHDNNEDALIMTTPRVDDADFLEEYHHLKLELERRLTE